jgi:hypothetical protein
LEPLVPRCVESTGSTEGFWSTSMIGGGRPGRKTRPSSTRRARTIAFALLDRAIPGEGYDQLVRHGCAFLQGGLRPRPGCGIGLTVIVIIRPGAPMPKVEVAIKEAIDIIAVIGLGLGGR